MEGCAEVQIGVQRCTQECMEVCRWVCGRGAWRCMEVHGDELRGAQRCAEGYTEVYGGAPTNH